MKVVVAVQLKVLSRNFPEGTEKKHVKPQTAYPRFERGISGIEAIAEPRRSIKREYESLKTDLL
jgi:hypothetical protein